MLQIGPGNVYGVLLHSDAEVERPATLLAHPSDCIGSNNGECAAFAITVQDSRHEVKLKERRVTGGECTPQGDPVNALVVRSVSHPYGFSTGTSIMLPHSVQEPS